MTSSSTIRPARRSPCGLRRIVAPGMERMALQSSPHAPQAPGDDAIFLHSQNEVLAARRMKPALTAENRTEEFLIPAHHSDDAAGWQFAHQSRPILRPALGLWAAVVHPLSSS